MERIRLRGSNLTPPAAQDSHTDANGHRDGRHRLSAEEMKHNFAVQPARESAFGSPRELLCSCVRCKWTFQVSPDTGSIVAFNNVGQPIEGHEADKRIATFAEGPCPAFAALPEYEELGERPRRGAIRERLHPLLHLLRLDRSA